uniref:Uncharacterized protein n=1 Tax=Physcomitrium patens TaxID=3218 RepID=A0A2K1JRB2_PHYPA|nr:hypothetical protein PHYPA_016460 [Physcomitrium patens]
MAASTRSFVIVVSRIHISLKGLTHEKVEVDI